MRWFETRGPVYPEENYVVARTEDVSDFVNRLKRGRYIVLFAPRQTGKTTFFQNALDALETQGSTYFPIQLNFEGYVDSDADIFYLEQFVQSVGGTMYLEVQTGRGRMDILILHRNQKYIVETKIWRGDTRYQAGKAQLAAYVRSEGAGEGYYVVFDHRATPEPRVETERLEGLTLRSYVIPVLQTHPSSV